MTGKKVLSVIFIEGFVTIAVEMLTIRQLITVVGNSVIITSLIIGFFLLFLSFGYYRGGQYTSHYDRILKNNFFWAALLLGIGLSYTFIQILFWMFFQIMSVYALLALAIYLLIVTAPLVYFLGQTVPITTNLFRHEHIGLISGKVLSISTLGSFLGSVLTTLVLMNYFGVAWTIFINFLLLSVLIFLLVDIRAEFIRILWLILAGIFIFLLNVQMENSMFVRTNNYGDYQIMHNVYYQQHIGNLLLINNSASSFLTEDKKGFEYIQVIKKILFEDLHFTDKDILVLGAGGFTLSAESTFGNRFVYVDIDPSLPRTVLQGFTDKINGEFIADDARKFLMQTHKKYDAVVSDVYSSRYTIPFHLLTREYFLAVFRALRPDGIAIFNIIANPMLKNHYSRRVDNTIRSVFNNCMSIPLPYHDGPANIIYICTANSENDKTIYTDNKNASMVDIFNNR
jgi:spermidine synthase